MDVQKPLTILVIEDNPDGREMLVLLLQIWGHEVVAAEDGPGGVKAALEVHPDVAFIDIGLPGFSGYRVAEKIREAEGGDHLLLIALTGYGQPGDQQRALDAGFDAHLIKPVDPDALSGLLAGISS